MIGVIPLTISITWQTVITAFAFVGAVIGLIAYFSKAVRWVDKQNKQDAAINELRQHHEDDMGDIKTEQTLLVRGILACLKGLQEQGCNGTVTATISEIEDHLNNKAHK